MNAHALTPRFSRRSGQAWARFRAHRRAWASLWILAGLYALSLGAELLCNDKPLLLRSGGRTFLPAFRSYTQDALLGNGVHTRMTDYRGFLADHADRVDAVVLAPFRSGVHQTFAAADVDPYRRIALDLAPVSHAAAVQFAPDLTILHAYGDTNYFTGALAALPDLLRDAPDFQRGVAARLRNEAAPAIDLPFAGGTVSLAPFAPRPAPPASFRAILRSPDHVRPGRVRVAPARVAEALAAWRSLSKADVSNVLAAATVARGGDWVAPVPVLGASTNDPIAEVRVAYEAVSWPFRPVPGHPMGFDSSGRDVFARVVYAMRTSLTFGLALVAATLLLGAAAGAVQGYFAGWVDIAGQRFTEIWAALPFLYIMILLGNTLGRSFGLLLVCYAAFNWIGAAAYVRAEFLRLRTRAFVDAARCQGLSSARIIFRHVLPNALTPIITLLPFALVGAIGSLAVLDYLGFGLPAGSASWGELLNQAQTFRKAWWLILYPSLALFTVMLLGVFIGEGLRDALDPRPYSKLS